MSQLPVKLKTDLIEAFAKARLNLVNYRRILLATGQDEVEPAPFHYDWSDILLNSDEHFAIEGFRESAKGQYVLRAFPLYALTFPDSKRDYIVLIKNNETEAQKKLTAIEDEYLSNPAISSNLVEIKQKSARIFSVDVKNDDGEVVNILIEAYGKGSSIRGLSTQDKRPKIVIIDDPQDLEDSKSPTVLDNDWDWFLSDVKFLGQYTRIFLIGNNLGEGCIIERIIHEKDNWGFKAQVIKALDDRDESMWQSKYKTADIINERESYRRAGKIETWQREKMCVATSTETQIFSKDDYRYYGPNTVDKLIRGCNISMTLDPASSKEITSCYRAFTVVATNPDNNWFLLDVPYGRWDSAQLVDVMFDKVKQWGLREVGIEKGMLEQVLAPFIYKEMSRRNTFFNIVPLEHAKQGTKLERIKLLQPRFKAHLIWFPDTAEWLAELESELSGVTKDAIKSLYIDLVDALAMQYQMAKAPYMPGPTQSSLPRQAEMATTIS